MRNFELTSPGGNPLLLDLSHQSMKMLDKMNRDEQSTFLEF